MAVYAEDVNYWKSSTGTPAMGWLEKAADEVRSVGGQVKGVSELDDGGTTIFVMLFTLSGARFKVSWPVLKPRAVTSANLKSAKIQAATALYHDVKSRCVTIRFLGVQAAFMPFMLLEGGKTVAEAVPDVFVPMLTERLNHADGSQ